MASGSDRNPSTCVRTGRKADGRLRKLKLVNRDRKGGPWTGLTLPIDRGKTVTKRFSLSGLGLLFSEKQIPQVVERFESGGKPKEALETVELRPREKRGFQ